MIDILSDQTEGVPRLTLLTDTGRGFPLLMKSFRPHSNNNFDIFWQGGQFCPALLMIGKNVADKLNEGEQNSFIKLTLIVVKQQIPLLVFVLVFLRDILTSIL